MCNVILKYLWKWKLDPEIRPDIQPDIRFINTNRQNCIKIVVSSQYVTIKKKCKFGIDPAIFGSVIRPDNQPDIRFDHTNEHIRKKFGVGIVNIILK